MVFISCLFCSRGARPIAGVEPIPEVVERKIVRSGFLRVKKQGIFSGWKMQWVVLQGETLTMYKPQTTPKLKQAIINLRDIQIIERVDEKPYCLLLQTANPNRRYLLSLKNDEELYDWQDDVYLRTPKGEGSGLPFDFKHDVHVGYDAKTGGFSAMADGKDPGRGLIQALETALDSVNGR